MRRLVALAVLLAFVGSCHSKLASDVKQALIDCSKQAIQTALPAAVGLVRDDISGGDWQQEGQKDLQMLGMELGACALKEIASNKPVEGFAAMTMAADPTPTRAQQLIDANKFQFAQ